MSGFVYIVASAAPPVMRLVEFLDVLQHHGWRPGVILTPTAATWIDTAPIEAATGLPVRVDKRLPGETDPFPRPDAMVAAPLTFNSLNKWAAGIGDTTAAGLLNESLGLDIPVIAAPLVSAKLRRHPAYQRSVDTLTSAGVTIMDPDIVTIRHPGGAHNANWTDITTTLDQSTRR